MLLFLTSVGRTLYMGRLIPKPSSGLEKKLNGLKNNTTSTK